MFETLLDEATLAVREYNEPKTEYLLQELAKHPDEAMPVLVKALRQSDKIRQATAIRAIHLIGYPKNVAAIPDLVYHISDPNVPEWNEAVNTLTDMGPSVVVPDIILRMWNKDNNQYWGYEVEGLCEMLIVIDRDYAVACGPTLVHILGQSDLPPDKDLDKGFLLDVLEKIGPDDLSYALPALIDLARREGISAVGMQTRRLLQSFNQEALEPYKLLLEDIIEKPAQEH